MPAVSIAPADLAPFAEIDDAKAEAMIANAVARAGRVAPCIYDESLSENLAAAAKSVIIDAILRKNEAGTGALAAQQAGPFGQTLDTRQPHRSLFWSNELDELRAICADHTGRGGRSGKAFSVDLTPAPVVAPWSEV